MRIAVAGEGAFGAAHIRALKDVKGADVVLLIGHDATTTQRVAQVHGLPNWTTDFEAGLASDDIEAVILATPTPLHARQAIACLEAGKHVLVEIPMVDRLDEAEQLVEMARKSGLIAMTGHIRRFNRGHAWIHDRIAS